MARYQVAIVDRPETWQPAASDDVPAQVAGPVEVLAETEDLFAAVDRAREHNEGPDGRRRWAVVSRAAPGRLWPWGGSCTPVRYRVMAIDWPDGWEPDSPLDVPNCVWQGGADRRADARLRPRRDGHAGLNRQCMDHPARSARGHCRGERAAVAIRFLRARLARRSRLRSAAST